MAANKQRPPYSVVSYFCGCGGLDLGFRGGFRYHNNEYKRLPFQILVAYDKEQRCVDTYNGYFGNHAKSADLSNIDVKSIPKATVLIGGFPCQEFSSCGPQGGLDSERGKLYKSLIDYMVEHSPSIVVGENVINLERMDNGNVLRTITDDLSKAGCGYKVSVWNMFAPDYGIPQRRERLFFICVRNDLYERYGFPEEPVAAFVGNHRSIEWAIGDLIDVADDSIPNQDQYFGAARAKKGNGQGDEENKKDRPAALLTVMSNNQTDSSTVSKGRFPRLR